jgi:type VI secretion system protein ImpB
MPESTQKKLTLIRPPRVQITYDVEIGDAIQMKELPFVAGILADLSGQPAEALPPMKDRKFVEIDRDNFNDVLKAAAPRVAVRVPNRLAKDDSMLAVELKFTSMDDFDPVHVNGAGELNGLVPQVEPLAKLFEARTRLVDLLAKLDGNDKLDALLQDVINNPESQKALKSGSTPAT